MGENCGLEEGLLSEGTWLEAREDGAAAACPQIAHGGYDSCMQRRSHPLDRFPTLTDRLAADLEETQAHSPEEGATPTHCCGWARYSGCAPRGSPVSGYVTDKRYLANITNISKGAEVVPRGLSWPFLWSSVSGGEEEA